MKNFLYSAFMLAVVILTACSNDDNGETQPKRGLTLNASVENLSSRATLKNEESDTWKFAFAENDKVSVSNSKILSYYTFTNGGVQFTCADAEATTEPADWYAYFPGNEVDLTNQSGKFEDIANKFAAAGTAKATTGENGLSITLKPKVAVLRVVPVDKNGILDIHVKTADGKWVTRLTAPKKSADFTVSTSDTKVTLLNKAAGQVKAGEINYVVVPAGVKIAIYNGDLLLNTTIDTGLKAGKYYTITSGPTTGTETAIINKETNETKEIHWVQLWAGGPRFATENVDKEMTWTEAAETGSDYVWGANWRTPTAEEVTEEGGLQAKWDKNEGKWVVPKGSPSINVTTKDGTEETVVFTGVQPGYEKNTLILYNKIEGGYSHFNFWTTTENNGYGCMYRIMISEGVIGIFGPSSFESKDTKCYVRPVLSIENITKDYQQ